MSVCKYLVVKLVISLALLFEIGFPKKKAPKIRKS
jgi:hypothetical protein